MYMSLLDYEVLARQKRESMLAEAERSRALARFADLPKRRVLRLFAGVVLNRFGATERPSVSTRTA